jgi:NAD(P)-dependent dehydrogenase (short-subunit alcohol dehydrogenase family)
MLFNRTPRLDLTDKVVVITGAGSGIGRALAKELTDRGANVAISDWNADSVAETGQMIEGRGTKVLIDSFDVSDRAAFEAHAQRVLDEFGRADIVINNAGVSLAAQVATMTYEDMEWVIGIDFWGVVYGTKAFLPHILERGDGAIVNVSSVYGLFGVPTQSGYNAAKFAVRGFTEALQQEVADTDVVVTRVHPGGIKTNIVRHGRIRESMEEGGNPEDLAEQFENAVRTTPERAAEIIVSGLVKRKPRILIGPDAVMLDLLVRLFPVRYQKVMGLLSRLMFRDPQTEAAEAGTVPSAVNHLTPDNATADSVDA